VFPQLSAAEMSQIASAFNNPASAQEKGITVGGNKYFFNKIDDLENIPVLHCAKVRH
jgi:profilin